jgi:hypothetical protein
LDASRSKFRHRAQVRDDLNIAATVFDDQTQQTTDRLTRS